MSGGTMDGFPWMKFRTDGMSKMSTFCSLAKCFPTNIDSGILAFIS